MRVTRMRRLAQAADDPGVDPVQHRERAVVERHHIRRIRERTEAEAGRPAYIVVLIDWSDFDAGYGERSVDLMGAKLRPVHLGVFGQKIERIAEPLTDRRQRLPRAPGVDHPTDRKSTRLNSSH